MQTGAARHLHGGDSSLDYAVSQQSQDIYRQPPPPAGTGTGLKTILQIVSLSKRKKVLKKLANRIQVSNSEVQIFRT